MVMQSLAAHAVGAGTAAPRTSSTPRCSSSSSSNSSSSSRCRRAHSTASSIRQQHTTHLLPNLHQHHSSFTQPRWMMVTPAAAGVSSGSSNECAATAARPTTAARIIHGPLLPAYGGACTRCSGHHQVPCTPEALAAMQALLDALVQHGRLDFASNGPPDPRFSLDYLWTAGPGRMLGVLLAVDADGALHTLRAFSGQMTESWHVPGWVGPVAGIINESPVYVRTRRVIERLSARLHQGQELRQGQQQQQQQQRQQRQKKTADQAGDFQQAQRQLLKRRRRALSHSLLRSIQDSYITSTAVVEPSRNQPDSPHRQQQQQQLSLLHVYLDYRQQHNPGLPVTRTRSCRGDPQSDILGMPAGAGDCCAIKLLHAAAQQGLRPLAMCEAWCGSAPGTATPAKQGRPPQPDEEASRQHATVYTQCDKCTALLGTMLCGHARAM